MIIVQPPEWNTPELYAITKQHLKRIDSKDCQVNNIHIHFPLFASIIDEHGNGLYEPAGYRLVNEREKCLTLHVNERYIAGQCTIFPFESHCGIIGIGHLSSWKDFAALWLQTVEDYFNYLKYSALIGGDGESAGYLTSKFIEKYGEGWVFQDMGKNRRMGRSHNIFWKLLPSERTLNINWWKGTKKPDAKQATETRSEGGVQSQPVQQSAGAVSNGIPNVARHANRPESYNSSRR